jgi:hypothetical protein
MSVEDILRELPKLETADLVRVRDLLNSIEDQRNAEHMKELARRLDDKDPSRWFSLEEVQRRLSLREDEPKG